MSKLPKHHYIPAFYLKQWTVNGRLIKFSRPHGDVVKANETGPSGTGYERGLYRLTGVSDELAEVIESGFMQTIDTIAAQAHQRLLKSDLQNWPTNHRSAWSRFIIGLLLRSPESVGRFLQEFAVHTENNLAVWRERYNTEKKPGDPPFEETDIANSQKVTIIALQALIDNPKLGEKLNGMTWGLIDVSDTKFRFVLSDRPILIANGLAYDNSHIMMPIGPTMMFFACNNQKMADQIRSLAVRDLVMNLNKHIVRAAIKFAWSTDRSQFALMTKHLSADAHLDRTFFKPTPRTNLPTPQTTN